MAFANLADQVLLWIHGRRLGLTSDGQTTQTSSALVLDGVPVASTRGAVIAKAVASGAGAGSIAVAGAVIGDNVLSVTDLSSGADVSVDFEGTITVAGHIQQITTTSSHQVLVVLQPQS